MISLWKYGRRLGTLLVWASLLVGEPASAIGLSRSILRAAEVDCAFGTILLHGLFREREELTITLDDGRAPEPLELAILDASSPDTVTVALPNGCDPPGAYRLEIGRGRLRPLQTFASLDVTLGSLGPEGPAGPPGAPAPLDPELLERLTSLEARVEELEIELGVCVPASETCDGLDNDCDGTVDEEAVCSDPPARSPLPGELVLTELLPNPAAVSDTLGEWFEIWNRTTVSLQVEGCEILGRGNEQHIITGAPEILPGAFVVFARSADPTANGGIAPHYRYDGVGLSNGGDDLSLTCGNELIDWVTYEQSANGASSQLGLGALDAELNDDPGNWCAGTITFGAGDRGSPGSENQTCQE